MTSAEKGGRRDPISFCTVIFLMDTQAIYYEGWILSEDLMSFTGFFTILNDKLVVLHNQMTS